MRINSEAWQRPQSLLEVAQKTARLEDFKWHLKDFLHAFKAAPAGDKLVAIPPLLATRFPRGEVADAYLAAVAVELSRELGRARPAWTLDCSRVLDTPWFSAKSDDLRIVLLHESPAGFRERNLFVAENALSVA